MTQHHPVERESTVPRGGAPRRRMPPTVLREVSVPSTNGTGASPRVHAANPATSWMTSFARELASQDWFIALYFAILLTATLSGSGPGRGESIKLVVTDIVVLAAGLALTRGGLIPRGSFLSTLLYRFTLFGTVQCSYFQLRVILPAVSSRAVDASIFGFDMRMFHFEPSLAWDRFVTPQTTEWFAFFYFGYFFILAGHVLPFLLVVKDTRLLGRFALGIFMVFCVGHLMYMVVPGYGPYQYFSGHFHNELSGGLYWRL